MTEIDYAQERLFNKQGQAFEQLEKFKKCYLNNEDDTHRLMFASLSRDIMTLSEPQLDRLIKGFESANMKAFNAKLEK